METCHRCGTVLPTTPGARYCPNCGELTNGASGPTQAFAAVGRGPGESGMTWALPAQPATQPATPSASSSAPQPNPTQALSAQGILPESELYAGLFRPEGGAPAHPNATQVMALLPGG